MAKKYLSLEGLAEYDALIKAKIDTVAESKADWNQNDANAIDYIKNRTHWVEQATEIVVPATTDTEYSYDLVSGWGGTNFDATYIVTLDGTTYQCTPWMNSFSEFCLGDSRLITISNDSGEEVADPTHPEDVPFHVNSYAEGDDWGGAMTEYWYFTYPDSETHTIEIAMLSDGNAVYHALDERFIPDTIARKTDLKFASESQIYSNAVYAINNGYDIYGVQIDSIRELKNGTSIIIIPDATNDKWGSNITSIKLNNFSEAVLYRKYSDNSGNHFLDKGHLKAGIPVRITYSDNAWYLSDYTKVVANDIYGNLSITRGGTGADTAEEALTNLSAVGYSVQTLTDAQKTQARVNIGAVSESELDELENTLRAEIDEAIAGGEVDLSSYETKEDAKTKLDEAKAYTDTKTSGLASTSSVNTSINTHNTSTSAHSDIRDLITGLTTRLNTLADSDDTTLDQLSEIVAYIKSNKSLIDGITTSKVNVSDIVNDLTTNSASKVLSAAQGVAIQSLINALQEELDGHTHAIADVSGLQSALDGKADGSHGTHVSYSTTAPVMDGTASVGSASTVARSDHKHPTDTSRASKTEFDTHVEDTIKHITSTERTNWNAAKTHADSAHAPSNAEKNQNAFSNIAVSGQTTVAADTTTDTVTFAGSNVTITTDANNDKVTFSVADGTTSAKGVVQLTNSTSSTSTTTAATPSSVKSAYDLANTANTAAGNAQTRADAAYTLAEGKVDSLSDLGITATATELNYVDGVTSNIQTQLNAKAASSTVTSHTENKSNPHGVTADQVGAYTKVEIDSKLGTKADASSIPTKTSQLTNDSGYITDSAIMPISISEIDEICGASIAAATLDNEVVF